MGGWEASGYCSRTEALQSNLQARVAETQLRALIELDSDQHSKTRFKKVRRVFRHKVKSGLHIPDLREEGISNHVATEANPELEL